MRALRFLPVALIATACSSLPVPAVAQEVIREGDARVIHVDANAFVRRTPDRAIVQLAVETPAPTAQEATRQNAERMDRVLAAVRALGIPPANIRTGRISLQPRYDQSRDMREPVRDMREPPIIGYTAMNSVVVTVDSIPLVGQVIDRGVDAGANRVAGIHFELRNPDAAQAEALRLAIERARRQAQVIADALGEPLGPALRVSTSGWQQPFRGADVRMEAAAAMPAPPPTPVEPGEVDVQAHVSITFRIGT